MYGETTTSLGLTKYTYSFGGLYIYLGVSTVNTGNVQADFIQAQYNANTNYLNDTSIAFWDQVYDRDWRPQFADPAYYGNPTSFRLGGYRLASLTFSPKSAIKLARLGVYSRHFYYYYLPHFVYSITIDIKISENGTLFGSGQALENMVPDLIHPCSESNKRALVDYSFYDIDLNFINNMSTDNFYVWYHTPFELMPWRSLSAWADQIDTPWFTLEIYV